MCELTINSSFDKVILGHVIEMRVIQKRLREKKREKKTEKYRLVL